MSNDGVYTEKACNEWQLYQTRSLKHNCVIIHRTKTKPLLDSWLIYAYTSPLYVLTPRGI